MRRQLRLGLDFQQDVITLLTRNMQHRCSRAFLGRLTHFSGTKKTVKCFLLPSMLVRSNTENSAFVTDFNICPKHELQSKFRLEHAFPAGKKQTHAHCLQMFELTVSEPQLGESDIVRCASPSPGTGSTVERLVHQLLCDLQVTITSLCEGPQTGSTWRFSGLVRRTTIAAAAAESTASITRFPPMLDWVLTFWTFIVH